MLEVVERRSANGKTFSTGGNNFRVSVFQDPIHYLDDDKKLQDIDTSPTEHANKFSNDTTPYRINVPKTKIAVDYHSRDTGWIKITLKSVGGITNFNISPKKIDNRIYYEDVVPGVDVYLVLRGSGVEWYKILKNSDAPRELEWWVDYTAERSFDFLDKHNGVDFEKDKIELTQSRSPEKTVGKRTSFVFSEVWTGRVSKIISKRTRRRKWVDEPVYPVKIDASVTEYLTSGAKDGVSSKYVYTEGAGLVSDSTLVTADSENLCGLSEYAGTTSSWLVSRRSVFNLFDSVAIPQGSTINSATFKIKSKQSYQAQLMGGEVFMEDADNAVVPSSVTDFLAKARTTAKTTFTGPISQGTWLTGTYSISSLVQEVISRSGWVSNNALQVFLQPPGVADGYSQPGSDATGYIKMVGYEATNTIRWVVGASHGGGRLDIDYTAPVAGGSLVPFNPNKFHPFLTR